MRPSILPQQTSQDFLNKQPQNTSSSFQLPSEGITLTLKHVTVPAESEKDNPFIIQQIGLRSSTLKIVDVATFQEKEQGGNTTTESALVSTVLEEPGDVSNGLFILFESLRRPHCY